MGALRGRTLVGVLDVDVVIVEVVEGSVAACCLSYHFDDGLGISVER